MTSVEVARRTAVVVAVLIGSGAALLLIYSLRSILVWLLVAVLLAASVAPAVSWLVRRRVPRWLAAGIVTLLAALITLGTITAVAVPLISQSRQLLGNLPGLVRSMFKKGSPLAFLDQRFHVVQRVRSISGSTVIHLVAGQHASIIDVFTRMLAFLAAAVSILAITLLLLLEGPGAWAALVRSLGSEHGARVDSMGRRMQHAVAGYVRGNLLISLLAGGGSFIAMSILHVPYPLPLALAVGLLDIIPLIGALLGATICVIVALGQGWLVAISLVIYFVVYQQIENHAILPVVYAKTVAMSPLVVLLVSLAGAVVGGLLGVLLAIPLASAAAIVVGDLARSHGVENLGDLVDVIGEEPPP